MVDHTAYITVISALTLALASCLLGGVLYRRSFLKDQLTRKLSQLQENENRLNKAELVAGVGNWEFHLSTGLVTASPGARRVYGIDAPTWSIPEIQKMPLPEYRLMLDEALKGLVEENRPYDVEFCIRRLPDQEIRHIHSIAEYDARNNIVFGVIHDITNRKKSEEALRRSEERYRGILENVEEAYYELDLQGNFTFINPSILKNMGYSLEEVLGVSFRRFVDEKDAGRLFTIYNQIYLTGETIKGFEWELIGKDGKRMPMESSASLIRDASGNTVGFRGVGRDMTWRKHTEEALKVSEARMRAITDSAQEAILMMDQLGSIAFWNPAAERIFGYTSAEALGGNLHELIAPERYRDAHRTAFPEWTKTGRGNAVGKVLELHALRKDGSEIIVELSLSAVHTENGWQAIGILHDITERKRAEEEMRNREKLQGVLEMAGAVCHELNQPLQSIATAAELLLMDDHRHPENDPLIECIHAGVEQIGLLTNKVMKITKYKAKDYMGGKRTIIDIEESSSEA